MHASPCFLPAALLSDIRARFHHIDRCPITDEPRIFFENGGGSLKLKSAIAVSAEVSALPDQEGRNNPASAYLTRLIEQGRDDLHQLLGSCALGPSRGQVISGETGTRLLYRLIRTLALALPPGPIMGSTLEHPASLDAARQWATRTGRRLIEVPFESSTGTMLAAHYSAAVTVDTRIATVIHTSMLTGFVADLPAICAAIRAVAPACFIVVDGIQHAPHGALDVAAYGADAYVFSPYKAFSRLSLGFAWINDRIHAIPHEHMLGKPGADWELGSRDPAFYAAQSEVINYLCWLGRHFTTSSERRAQIIAASEAMAAHEAALVQLLIDGDAQARGLSAYDDVTLVGPPSAMGREGLVSFTLKGIASPTLVGEFARHGIRVHARVSDGYSGHILGALGLSDCVRVSVSHYNDAQEVRQFLWALAQIRT
ncbi:MAG: aminotransferase class V-fold PLP-dependent enzyme [Betaproteobacteria bacterium]